MDPLAYLTDLFRHAAGTVLGLYLWRGLRREWRAATTSTPPYTPDGPDAPPERSA